LKGKSILKIVGAVAVINLLSRLVGFFREVLIGFHFGTSFQADSVVAAYTIPNFLYIAAGGAISTAFISIYSKTNRQIQSDFRQVIVTYSLLLFSLISVCFFVFPRFWTELVFWGMQETEREVTASLFKVMGVSTVFLVLSMLFTGILNSHEQFKSSAAAPLLNNVVFVLIAGVFFYSYGAAAYSYGALAGAVLMLLLLVYSLRKGNYLQFRLKWGMPGGYVKRFFLIALPILFGGATLQFYFLIHRIFAAQLESGAIAALNYASKFVQLPQTILMTAVTMVIYPLLAKKIAENQFQDLNRILNRGIKILIFIMVPASIYVFFFSEQLIRLLFEYGQFTADSTIMTARLLKVLVVGMLAHAMNVYLTRFFYAMEKPNAAIVTGLIAVFGVNVVITILFIDHYGEIAIAWATTISAYVQMILLMILLSSRLNLRINPSNSYGKYILLCISLIVIMKLGTPVIHLVPSLWAQLAVSACLFLLSFYVIASLLKIPEIEGILKWKKKN
jgi:putative peptidoglycan lipid II flippase